MIKKQPKKLSVFQLQDSILQKIDRIKDRIGFQSRAETIRYIISEFHDKKFPDYVEAKLASLNLRTPKAKAEREVEAAEAKRQLMENKGKEYCEILGGTLERIGQGFKCTWNTYRKINASNVFTGNMTLPIEDISEAEIENQFKNGTQEEINTTTRKTLMPEAPRLCK